MPKVYVVTPNFTDYGICGVFSTKKKAEDYIAKVKAAKWHVEDDLYEIEEWPLDETEDLATIDNET